VADKLTQQITEALSQAAAEPTGLPLYASKTEPGLFVSTAGGKAAAQKCLNDGFVRVVGCDPRGKTARELYGLNEKGWNFLLAQGNPKQVLEDFVRVLESRRGAVEELLDIARRMAAHLQGLKEAVNRVLPSVIEKRIHSSATSTVDRLSATCSLFDQNGVTENASFSHAREQSPTQAQATVAKVDLAAAIVSCLEDWSGVVGEDCPLPKLYQSLLSHEPELSIGKFHDSLRNLHAAGAIYLHPWTGPLYALPEPSFALLAGHNIAYYASVRSRESP
jgi:hypothetical protein